MIILGIDPGSRFTGYGVVEVARGKPERLIEYGALKLDTQDDHHLRLKHIYERITGVIERCLPDACAVEMPVYGRNPQSMLKLGRAQAAAMLAALNRGIPVTEYTPKEVKKAVTGVGQASKEQVAFMVRTLLGIEADAPKVTLDASDALAVAVCHAHRLAHGAARQHKNWADFVRSNPDRIG